MLGPSYIAGFSSKGPTADGRAKPDIIAPGKNFIFVQYIAVENKLIK